MTIDPGDERRAADTAAKLFLACERSHAREAALEQRDGDRGALVPDWRFARQVLRIALYLRERAGARAGDHVAIVAPVDARSLAVEWAAFAHGLVASPVHGVANGDDARAALSGIAPAVVIARDAAVARAAREVDGVRSVLVLDGAAEGDLVVPYAVALDLGATLDTAERAQSIRAAARAVDAASPALAWHAGSNGRRAWSTLTQGELASRVRRLWAETPPRAGEARYFAAREPRLELRILLHACIADGVTRVVLGAPPPPARAGRHRWLSRLVRT